MKREIEFWIEYGSTYTYLSVARIGKMAQQKGVNVVWRPFFLISIMAGSGLKDGPFVPFPQKMKYMWRDLERRAHVHQIPYRKPSQYPVNSLLTARVALLAAQEGWCQEFSEEVFSLHWTQDILIGSEDNLDLTLRRLGKDPEATKKLAIQDENKLHLKAQTKRAHELGIFGSPSFMVGDELFWGDDRLEEAFEWCLKRTS